MKEVTPSPDRKMIKLLTFEKLFPPLGVGTLRSDDSDGNGDATKAIGLKTIQQRASRFFVHFFAVTERLRRENA